MIRFETEMDHLRIRKKIIAEIDHLGIRREMITKIDHLGITWKVPL